MKIFFPFDIADAVLGKILNLMAADVRAAGAPRIGARQWDRVWRGIRERTHRAAEEPPQLPLLLSDHSGDSNVK